MITASCIEGYMTVRAHAPKEKTYPSPFPDPFLIAGTPVIYAEKRSRLQLFERSNSLPVPKGQVNTVVGEYFGKMFTPGQWYLVGIYQQSPARIKIKSLSVIIHTIFRGLAGWKTDLSFRIFSQPFQESQ